MKRKITAGTASFSLAIFAQDSSSSIGAGLGGLAFNSPGLVVEYRRNNQSAWTTVTLSAGTLGTWSSGGWVADGGLAGAYEVGIPDAAVASGARAVYVRCRGANNMLPVLIEVELDLIGYQDGVRGGLTALPNVNAGAAGGLPLGNASGQVTVAGYASGQDPATLVLVTPANRLTTDANGRIQVQSGTGNGQLQFTAGVVHSDLRSLFGTALSEGAAGRLATAFVTMFNVASPVFTVASPNQTGDSFARLGAPTGASVSADLTTVRNFVDDLEGRLTNARATNLDSIPSILTGVITISGVVGTISSYTEVLPSMVQADGGGGYQYTTTALQLAPTGSAGTTDWTSNERAAIRSILGIPGAGSTPVDPTVGIMDTIRDLVVANPSAVVAALRAAVVKGTYTFDDLMKDWAAAVGGPVTGGGANYAVPSVGWGGASTQVVYTDDGAGNRTVTRS